MLSTIDTLVARIEDESDVRAMFTVYRDLVREVGELEAYSSLNPATQGRVREARIALRHTSAQSTPSGSWKLHDRNKPKEQ